MSVPVSIEVLAALSEVDVDTGRDLAIGPGAPLASSSPDPTAGSTCWSRSGATAPSSSPRPTTRPPPRRALVRWADSVLPRRDEHRSRGRRAGWPTCRRCGAPSRPPARTRRLRDARLRAGQPGLLLPLHRDASPRRRRDPGDRAAAAATGRPRSAPRSPGAPASPRPSRAAPTRACGCWNGPTSTPASPPNPDLEEARTASIRAEMHLDAGRPRPGRGRGPARDRARPRHRPDRPAGDPHPRRTRSSSGATSPARRSWRSRCSPPGRRTSPG